MTDDWLAQYTAVRVHRGKLCAVHKFMFTWGLLVGLSEDGYEHRYCYAERMEAMDALDTWADEEHPPGRWIKRKGLDAPELEGPCRHGHPCVAPGRRQASPGAACTATLKG